MANLIQLLGVKWKQHLDISRPFLLIMTVNPGLGGQQFIKTTLPKIVKARKMLNTLPHKPLQEVDCGVNLKNIAAGADILVAGAAIFGTDDYQKTISVLKTAANGN